MAVAPLAASARPIGVSNDPGDTGQMRAPLSPHFVAVTLLYQITKFLLRTHATWGRHRCGTGLHMATMSLRKTIDIGKRPFVLRRRNER